MEDTTTVLLGAQLRVKISNTAGGERRFRIEHVRRERGRDIWRSVRNFTTEQLLELGRILAELAQLDPLPARQEDWRTVQQREEDQRRKVTLNREAARAEREAFAAKTEIELDQGHLLAEQDDLRQQAAIQAFGDFTKRVVDPAVWATVTFSQNISSPRAWVAFKKLRFQLQRQLQLPYGIPAAVAMEHAGYLHFHVLLGQCPADRVVKLLPQLWRKSCRGDAKAEVYNAELGAGYYMGKTFGDGDFEYDFFDAEPA